MYLARVNDVSMLEEVNVYSVSFLKKHSDGSYYWPDKEYISDVDKSDVLKLSNPSEDGVSGTSPVVRVKLSFSSSEINSARAKFHISVTNVC